MLQTALKKFLEAKEYGPKLHQGQQSLKQHEAALPVLREAAGRNIQRAKEKSRERER